MSIQGMRGRAGALRLRSMLIPALLLTGACTEQTWWDARGSYTAAVTLPGEAAAQRTGSASDPTAGQTEERIDLCQLSQLDLGLAFVQIAKDKPAAIEVRTARPLCQVGKTQITGGSVLIWGNPAGQPSVLQAMRSDAWTVTGELEVTSYLTDDLPDLDVGETASTERIEGKFTLTATGPGGAVIRIDGATFQLEVTASRVKLSIS